MQSPLNAPSIPPQLPPGFRAAALHCGLKRSAEKEDLSLFVCDGDAAAAGVYTTNQVFAAPVKLDRARTPNSRIRAIVVNSGNANACTGPQGERDAAEMARLTAQAIGCDEQQVLVMSTGIIGEFLPMAKISAGIAAASKKLERSPEALATATRGIMTTDAFPKTIGRTVELAAGAFTIAGLCKGAGMIGPNMATMLGVLLTDAPLTADQAQEALRGAVELSFNAISVDGHMSTNDTVLLLAGGNDRPPLAGPDFKKFKTALAEMCSELAKMIPTDGEGASHLITIDVLGCRTSADAREIARTVAASPLVKTAVAGNDPNWGRFVSAAGYAPVRFDAAKLTLRVNGLLLYQNGAPVSFDAAAVSDSMKAQPETRIELRLGEGDASARFWTSDLTYEYVRINADYHT